MTLRHTFMVWLLRLSLWWRKCSWFLMLLALGCPEPPRVEPWEDTVHLGWWPCAIIQNWSFHLAGTLPGCPVFHYCAGLGGDPGPGSDPFPACGQRMSLLFLPSAADSFCTPLSDL